ncbi:MAG: spoIIIJ-associated protein [Clostridia bacterium]|jgi:spoIIIJ-associated protein|nr:single-stranded nucleic acid binding [Clostridiales bacterium]MDK2984374.1 spoIIIJ-associated protein [Clostridia bacterium]
MRSVEVTGKTVEDAISNALEQLGVGRDDVEIEVLEEPNKGFLGLIGHKDARVKVTEKENPAKICFDFLKETCRLMGINVEIEYSQDADGYLKFNINADNPGLLIGRRGETLDSLQYLTNLVVNKKVKDKCKIILDTEGYREKREKTLINLANRLSEKVKKYKRNVVLEPMAPHERRIIHTALQMDPQVKTYSEGEEPHRKVVIAFKNNNR